MGGREQEGGGGVGSEGGGGVGSEGVGSEGGGGVGLSPLSAALFRGVVSIRAPVTPFIIRIIYMFIVGRDNIVVNHIVPLTEGEYPGFPQRKGFGDIEVLCGGAAGGVGNYYDLFIDHVWLKSHHRPSDGRIWRALRARRESPVPPPHPFLPNTLCGVCEYHSLYTRYTATFCCKCCNPSQSPSSVP